jgi:signal transduction histidine kinase
MPATYILFLDSCLNTLKRLYAWRRVRVVIVTAFIVSLPLLLTWQTSYWILISRLLLTGFVALTLFGIFERWPKKLPNWLARWALQVAAVAIVIPFVTAYGYYITTLDLPTPWWRDKTRLEGFGVFTFLGLIIVPWTAVAALLKQIKNEAQTQALTFALERSKYENEAIHARLRLLQAQIEPHFLFNTLANVRELVYLRAPNATDVLDSLIAYLRAAMPQLSTLQATMKQELDLVRAYCEVMQMRMPDRLQFSVQIDDAANAIICPPMTLLTLVENAMRHGIDPAERGGKISVNVAIHNGVCRATVTDTGVGIAKSNNTLGTGLTNLAERLQLAFAGKTSLTLSPIQPHGTCAEITFPATFTS